MCVCASACVARSKRTDIINLTRMMFRAILCCVWFIVVGAARRPQLWRLGGNMVRRGVFGVHGALLMWRCAVFRGVFFAILAIL